MKLAADPLAFRGRILFLTALVVFGFFIVLIGYYRVQILNQERYEALGEKYRIKKTRAKATRGLIYDRNENLITQNMPTYNLVFQRDEMSENWRTLKSKLSRFLAISEEELDKRYARRSHLLSQPILLKEDITYKESLRIMRHKLRFPGLAIETAEKRFYSHHELFAHVLGYVGEATKEQLDANEKLRMGDIVGKNGIELAYNEQLTGEDGSRTIHIDSRGVYRSNEISKEPIAGDDLYLTLDIELQELAMEALGDHSGSIVMMDIQTGGILVYISAPAFDPNLFTTGISRKDWEALINLPTRPFLNRPVQGAYAPGSVFKLVTALTALKNRKITPETKHFCAGQITHYNHEFKCHNRAGHGWVDLEKAIQTSCNVFFWQVSMDLAATELAEVARDLGFGRDTGIDLIGEKPGLMPTPEWKKTYMKEIWYPGDTLNISVGQGSLLATPIQIVQLMGILGSRGKAPQPHLLLKRVSEGRTIVEKKEHGIVPSIDPNHYELLVRAMWQVVNGSEGTGSGARVPDFDVCGKTGTAQLKTFTSDEEHKNEKFKNAWFAGFAPRDNARVAIMVLVEKAKSGGAAAAPIAKRLFQAYKERMKEENPS